MTNSDTILKPSLGNRIAALLIAMFVMLIICSLLKGVLDAAIPFSRNMFLVESVIQSLFVFIFPAWVAARLTSNNPLQYLKISQPVRPLFYFVAALLLICITPAMNLIIDWNANLQLPKSMAEIADNMRELEDNAARLTDIILSDSSWWGLISGVIVIGCITGFAEEIFFRAGLQRAFTAAGFNCHVAVWTVAFIFSFAHLQFFGFVPRLLLGALFGYIYHFSGSLRVSAFTHALNNSIVVVGAWFASRGIISTEWDKQDFGLSPVVACLFSVLSIILIIYICKKYKYGTKK